MKLDPLKEIYKSKVPATDPSSKTSTEIVCPNCSNSARAEDINIQDKIAKCSSCHQVFGFEHALQSLLERKPSVQKPVLGRQKDIDVFKYQGQLSISIINFTDWYALSGLLIGPLGFLVSMISYFEEGQNTIPFIIAFFFVMVFAVYRLIAYRNNKSYIDVDDKYLYVKQRPKQFLKDKAYDISRIRQIYPKVYGAAAANGSHGYYHLWMVYDGPEGEEHVKLTPYLRSRSRALYLEQELENYLNIADTEVPEETKLNNT